MYIYLYISVCEESTRNQQLMQSRVECMRWFIYII